MAAVTLVAWGLVLVLLSGGAFAQQRCAEAAPDTRFQDNGDGTITDLRLHLMWTRCSAPQAWSGRACAGALRTLNWAQAQAFADEVNQRGTFFFTDWRIPQLRELASITDMQCANPRVNLGLFPDTPPQFYWTASTRPVDGMQGVAYALSFGAESVELMDKKEAHHVRLVRDAR